MAFVHSCAGHFHLLDSLRKILQQALEQGATVNLESVDQKRGVGPKGVDTEFASAGEQDDKEEKGESGEQEEEGTMMLKTIMRRREWTRIWM